MVVSAAWRARLVLALCLALAAPFAAPLATAQASCTADDRCYTESRTITNTVMVIRGDLAVLDDAHVTIQDSVIVFRPPSTPERPTIRVAPDAALTLRDVTLRTEDTIVDAVISGSTSWTRVEASGLGDVSALRTWSAQGGDWRMDGLSTGPASAVTWTGVSLRTHGGDAILGNDATFTDVDTDLRRPVDAEDASQGMHEADPGALRILGDGRVTLRDGSVRGVITCREAATLSIDGTSAVGQGILIEAACDRLDVAASSLLATGSPSHAILGDGATVSVAASGLQAGDAAVRVRGGTFGATGSGLDGAVGLLVQGGDVRLEQTVVSGSPPVDCPGGRLASIGGTWHGSADAAGRCPLHLEGTELAGGTRLVWDGRDDPFRIIGVRGDDIRMELLGAGTVLGGPGSLPITHLRWDAADQRVDALPEAPLEGSTASLRYADADEDGRLDAGETLYIGGAGPVAAGMLRMPRDGSAALVSPSDPAVGGPLVPLDGRVAYLDVDDDGTAGAGDLAFWDDGDGRMDAGDVWLAPGLAGTPARPFDGTVLDGPAFSVAGGVEGFILDSDGDTTLGRGDVVLGPELPGRSQSPAAAARLTAVVTDSVHASGALDITASGLVGQGAHALRATGGDLLLQHVALVGDKHLHLDGASRVEAHDSLIDGDANTVEPGATLEAFVRFAPRVTFPNGAPAAGAQVTATQAEEQVASGTSDERGVPFAVQRRSITQDAAGVDEPDAIRLVASLGDLGQDVMVRPGIDEARIVLADEEGPTGALGLRRSDGRFNTAAVGVAWDAAADDASAASYRVELLPGRDDATILVDGQRETYSPQTLGATAETAYDITLPGQGAFIVQVTALDAAGNDGATDALDLAWDTQAPLLSVALGGEQANGWFRGPATLQVDAEDAASGIAELHVQVDGSRVEAAGNAVQIGGDGHHTVQTDAYDAAGNVASRQVRLRIDTTPPVIPTVNLDRATLDAPGAVRLGFTGTFLDALSGLDRVEVRTEHDGRTHVAERFLPPVPHGVDIHVDAGRTTIEVVAVDRAGNEQASRPFQVLVDAAPPALLFDLNATVPADGVIDLVLADDSGVASLRFYVDGVLVQQVSREKISLDAATLGPGRHEVAVVATDAIGNTARYHGTLEVKKGASDKESPALFAPLLGGIGWAAWRGRRIRRGEQMI